MCCIAWHSCDFVLLSCYSFVYFDIMILWFYNFTTTIYYIVKSCWCMFWKVGLYWTCDINVNDYSNKHYYCQKVSETPTHTQFHPSGRSSDHQVQASAWHHVFDERVRGQVCLGMLWLSWFNFNLIQFTVSQPIEIHWILELTCNIVLSYSRLT